MVREEYQLKTNVLDDGYVQLAGWMGDDKAIVDAARISIAGEKVKPIQEDVGLIRYLMRHRHSTPFEMVEFKFRVKMPIFVARQWVRHRTASINELSARYSVLPSEFYVPDVEHIQTQAKKNKQGRSGNVIAEAPTIRQSMADSASEAHHDYNSWIDKGVARELARINLPLSTYTEWIWKIDLHNLFHFLSLRLNPHSQFEIRVYAEAMAEMVKMIVPIAWQAFEDFRLNSITLSSDELAALRDSIRGREDLQHFKTKREADEWKVKRREILGGDTNGLG